jgi:TolA-binding protein
MRFPKTLLLSLFFYVVVHYANSQEQSLGDPLSNDQSSAQTADPSTLVKLELLQEFERIDRSVRELRSMIDDLSRELQLFKQKQEVAIHDLEGRVTKSELADNNLREKSLSFERQHRDLLMKVEVLEEFLAENLGELVSASDASLNSRGESLADRPRVREKKEVQKAKMEAFSDVKDFYDYVLYQEFYRGHFENAVKLFADIVTQYPEHYLVPNAHYWMALSYFNLNPPDKERALETTSILLDLPKNHNKYADALLLQGQIFFSMRKCVNARESWERIIRELPVSSKSVKEAKERLKAIEKEGCS